ncbi:MAG: hypothetical protein ABW003_11310 [Microvirga sp.]
MLERRRQAAMSEPDKLTEIERIYLRCRIAPAIAVYEQVIETLSVAASVLRDAGDAGVRELNQAVRTQRVGIIKRRAIRGASGRDV